MEIDLFQGGVPGNERITYAPGHDDVAARPEFKVSRRRPLFRAIDVARALRAGAMAGVRVCVHIAKNGELTVSPMATEAPAADVKPNDTQPGVPGLRSWD